MKSNHVKLLLVVFFLLLILTSGCTSSNYEPYKYAKNGTYYNSELNLKFNYPREWEIVKELDAHEIICLFKRIAQQYQDILCFRVYTKNDYAFLGEINISDYENEQRKKMVSEKKIIFNNSEIKKISNREWMISNIISNENYEYSNNSMLETFCPTFLFQISYYSDNPTLNLTPIMESLECGEVKNP
jgi:hypothetical protein